MAIAPRRPRGLWRNLWHRRLVEGDLDAELRAYVELLTAEKIRAGLSPDDARRAALLEAGGVEQVKEEVRDARAGAWIDAVARDVRHAARGLRRAPGFAMAVVTTLAIGIGLNTAVFTLVYSALTRPLPIRNADRVVNVYQQLRGGPGREVRGNSSFVSYAEFQGYAQSPAFSSAAVHHAIGLSMAGVSNGPVNSELVSCDYFNTLGTRPFLGRTFARDECERPGSEPVVVLSHAMWRAQFGADSSVIGRVVRVNGLPLTIVGVTEPGFRGISIQPASMWIPITMQPALEHGRDSILVHPNASWLVMTARLAPGATIDQARAQVSVAARRLEAEYTGRHIITTVARGAFINFPEVSSEGALPIALTLLLGFTVVAMACANVMGLLLARGLARRREIAIRLSLGASRARLIQQLLIESSLLAVAGATIGMAFVLALPGVLRALSPIGEMQLDASPDLRVVAYAFVMAMAATLLVGLMPALQSTSVDLVSAFKGVTVFGRHSVRPSRIRSTVVGVQMGGSALLLVMAALFLRGALRASSVDPGFITHNVVAFSMNVSPLGYDDARAAAIYRDLTDRIARAPGVDGVAMATRLPLGIGRNTESVTPEHDYGGDVRARNVNAARVSGSYFKTLGIRIVNGSVLDTTVAVDGSRSAVVSASMAAAVWPGVSPLGERFQAGNRWYRVVGVAAEVSTSSLARRADPTAYLAQSSVLEQQIIVRTDGSPVSLLAEVPAWARAVDAQLVVQSERFEDRIAIVLLPAQLIAGATATLGTLALLLAAIGVAGVVSFGLGQRRREVAVRLAVGATGRQVVSLMMQQGTTPIVAGVVGGLALAALLGQVVRGFLLGVSPLDPGTYAIMIVVLLASSALATYLPSRGAARVDPASVLRDEG